MPVPIQSTLFNESVANGLTTSFPYQFMIASADDITVELDGVATTTGFAVTGVGEDTGGSIEFAVAPASGTTVLRYLDPVIKRDEDYQQLGDFKSETVDRDFDRIWLALQSFMARAKRAIKLPVATAGDQAITESEEDRANTVVGFDALGKLKLLALQTGTSLVDLAASAGASLIGFIQSGSGAVERTVEAKLREWVSVKDFGAVGDGVADDTAAIQAAIAAGGQNATIYYPEGAYKITASITLQPQQNHTGQGAVFIVSSGVSAFVRTTDGFPGRIKFSGFRFEGTGYTGKGVSITNNTPFVQIENCYFTGFLEGVRLDGSYCSNFKDSHFSYNRVGALLINETHSSSLINCFFDGNTYTGLGINGESSGGNLGSNAIHNVTTVGCAFQNSEFGVWAEECYEVHLINTYHEGNSKADLRLGVADAGSYERACYHFTIDGWQSSSPCASGKNIIIEHAVGGTLRGLAFNDGTPTTTTVLEVDAYSDRIGIDYHRVGHASFTATAPFNVPAGRVIVGNNGRKILPWGLRALKFGSPESTPGSIYGGYTPGSYRPTLQVESIGSSQDMSFKTQDLERHYDADDNLGFTVDHLNDRVETAYTLRPATDNTLPLGGSGNRWSVVYAGTGAINTSDEREKQDIEAIPQEWLDAWADVQYTRFKFRDAVAQKGPGARWHVGLIAQRIKKAFEARGLDAFDIGLLCFDRWDESTDVDGNVTPAGELFGVRYDQALAMECAYLRSKLNT